jgi:hypothetical protein
VIDRTLEALKSQWEVYRFPGWGPGNFFAWESRPTHRQGGAPAAAAASIAVPSRAGFIHGLLSPIRPFQRTLRLHQARRA